MENAPELHEVFTTAASSWPDLTPYVDPNTGSVEANLVDVLYYANQVKALARLELPIELPDREAGRRIVEIADGEFVAGQAKRLQPTEVIALRATQVLTDIKKESLLTFEEIATLVVALFMWHGCICMSKSLRWAYVTPTGERPYSLEQRQLSYEAIKLDWQSAANQGNPWVRYGVSLAKRFETARGNPIVDDWLPKDSPYWE